MWSNEKYLKTIEILTALLEQYEPDVLSVKRFHPSRSSVGLDRLLQKIITLAEKKRLKVCRYGIKEMEACFAVEGRRNKRKMAEAIVSEYPILHHELQREFDPDPDKRNKNPYYIRMFEAVGLAAVCFHEEDNSG